MGAIAHTLGASRGRTAWLWGFLREELAPYKGRTARVVRMVAASTLVMIVCMTFRIPYAAFAGIYTLVISSQSLKWSASSTRAFLIVFALGVADIFLGAMLVLGNDMLRFFWVSLTFFLAFYGLSVIRNYGAAVAFGFLIVVNVPLFDSHASLNSKISGALWAVGGVALGMVAARLMETAAASFGRADELTDAITERLAPVEDSLTCYARGEGVPEATRSALLRLATVGTSRLRQMLHRSGHEAVRTQQMGALVALVGRLVDLGVNLAHFTNHVEESDRQRVRDAARNIAEIRSAVVDGTSLAPIRPLYKAETSPGIPLLTGIDRTIALMRETLAGTESVATYLPDAPDVPKPLLVPDALTNPEHLKFALRGCLAAEFCYIAYNALSWPGISAAVITCLLTALTTAGASHRRQLLRFGGSVLGCLVIGLGAQVFILPHIDSIGGFVLFFAAVVGLAAWITTSGPRLSNLGLQIAIFFFLINLQEFRFETSLTLVRDRVLGVVLGLVAMWLVFDWLWSTPASVEMKKEFVTTIRLLAQFAREPVSGDRRAAIDHGYELRETIHAQFDKVRSLADGVLFEFGPSRQQDLALREHIREWQPQLRTLFFMRIASLNYRLQLPGFELPEAIQLGHRAYDDRSAGMLDEMADRIEGKTAKVGPIRGDTLHFMTETAFVDLIHEPSTTRIDSFMTLLRGIDGLTASVAEEIANDSSAASN